MTAFQIIFVVLLLIGSAAALFGKNRMIIPVMWGNYLIGSLVDANPLHLALVDLVSVWLLLVFVETKAALTVAVLFILMLFVYQLAPFIGIYATYSIVDVLAYVQIFAMGSTGFGKTINYIRDRYRRIFNSPIFIQSEEMDPSGDAPVVMGKDARH